MYIADESLSEKGMGIRNSCLYKERLNTDRQSAMRRERRSSDRHCVVWREQLNTDRQAAIWKERQCRHSAVWREEPDTPIAHEQAWTSNLAGLLRFFHFP